MLHDLKTKKKDQFIEITNEVEDEVQNSGIKDGIAVIYIPHTTAGVTINENADPDVVRDLLRILDANVPERGGYLHDEGNSAAHMKASLMGSSCTVPIQGGRLALGRWQGIWFCEFDGPRQRRYLVTLVEDDRKEKV